MAEEEADISISVESITDKAPESTNKEETIPETSTEKDTEEPQKAKEEPPTSSANYDPKNVHYEGDLAIYTDPSSGTQYEWNSDKKEWSLRNVQYEFDGDTHIYTDHDGFKYFWDKEKSAWFPKVDDDFIAQYQMSYGTDPPAADSKPEKSVKTPEAPKVQEPPRGEKRKPAPPTWFEVDDAQNTKVYVSNLPTDITEEEFVDLMQKCGLVLRDGSNGRFKIKLYREPGTEILRGDGLCTYIRVESVQLALNLLDDYEFRGRKIKVERAKFQLKGAYNPELKPKMKKRKDKMKLKKMQDKLFDWRPEKKIGDRAKHEKVVIVRNLFDPAIFDEDVGLILEFQNDLREEASKIGVVKKIVLYDRHPEGVAQINMTAPEEADEVVKNLNGRWFMKRQLTAEIWDGKTKFKIAETDAQMNERLENWDKFLEDPKETESVKIPSAESST